MSVDTRAGPIQIFADTPDGIAIAGVISAPAMSALARANLGSETLEALGWDRQQLDPLYPPAIANAGTDHFTVGVRDGSILDQFDYDFDAMAAIMGREGWTSVHAFWAESPGCYHVRNALANAGVREDAASGSAAAAFAGYLRDLGRVHSNGGSLSSKASKWAGLVCSAYG